MKLELTLKNGQISAYGFACGYTESKPGADGSTMIFEQHGVFHVRKYNADTGHHVFWKSYRTLTEAREAYRNA